MTDNLPDFSEIYGAPRDDKLIDSTKWDDPDYAVRWYDDDDLLFHDKLYKTDILLDKEIVPDFARQILQFDPKTSDPEFTLLEDDYLGTIKMHYWNDYIFFLTSRSYTRVEFSLAKEVAEYVNYFQTKS